MANVSIRPVTGSFTGTGTSNAFTSRGGFSMSLSGFGSATVVLERSFDEGSTWLNVESFTTDAERRVDEPNSDVFYRFECTVYSSGTIAYRLS